MTQDLDASSVRAFDSDIPQDLLDTVQAGVFRTRYKGVPFLKSPFDIGIYLQLLGKLRPRTVIEVGAKRGGSALWFADMMGAHGVEAPKVVAVDIAPEVNFTDPRITFLQGDANQLGEVLTPELLDSCLHPLLVVEDSSHHYRESIAVLGFFHDRLKRGDYIVIEDGVVSHFADGRYAQFKDGPNRAVRDFLGQHPDAYQLDVELCDHYGRNVTYNPNGWLRRL
jgi:cephalosporin hydroxylase